MTPRDVQDYEAQAKALFRAVMDAPPRTDRVGMIAAALRAEGRRAQSRTAMLAAGMVRGLTAPTRGEISELARQIQDLASAPESPPGPAAYVDALQDVVHTTPGKLISSQPIRPPAPRLDNLAAESVVESSGKLAPNSPAAPAPDLRKECGDNSPEWWTGRWQDWHRGHGCSKDDGKPTTPEGVAEFAAHGRLSGRASPDPREKRIAELEAALAKAHDAIRWACGEEPLKDGRWFDYRAFGHEDNAAPPYWWRSILRLYSGLPDDPAPSKEPPT